MSTDNSLVTTLLEAIVEHLDIPKSYYERAVARHKSLGDWLCRQGSRVAAYRPHVSSQGSFRYGTVNRPLLATEVYDLDNVTVLAIAKSAMTQRQLKELYGFEVKEYAKAHGMAAPVEEKDRCWRLIYADEVNFHLDTLPCVPEDHVRIQALVARGVPPELAARAVAITDRRHPAYDQITLDLLSSNPRGFAVWFETQTRPFALNRMRQLVAAKRFASVEEVPPYEWKTPLQRSIQLLKRHRDVMFRDDPAVAPISMIITNLAAHAYGGEGDLASALRNIVEKMPKYVNATRPRVPNPADPAEDDADKWAKNPALEENFWAWLAQVRLDINRLPAVLKGNSLSSEVRSQFRVELTQDQIKQFESPAGTRAPLILPSAPTVVVAAAPRPWGVGA